MQGAKGIDALLNNNYHSLIGAAGLGIKYVTEKAIGRVIYPFNLQEGNKKTDSDSKFAILNTTATNMTASILLCSQMITLVYKLTMRKKS